MTDNVQSNVKAGTKPVPITTGPAQQSYDVVIIGGAIMGSSVAWFLSSNPDFTGRILVVERDTSYQWASTSHTNSCIRQQFSSEINIRISQFGAGYIHDFRHQLGDDQAVPDIALQSFGYMYLADNQDFADALRKNQKLQASCGAATQIMERHEIAAAYPFYRLDDIILGSINRVNEGYFDGATMFDWWKRKARQNGVEYIENEVVAISRHGDIAESVTLKTGEVISAGTVVNASGPRAAATASMLDITLPVEPRRRYSFLFKAEKPLPASLPLTIDPAGVHVHRHGEFYLCGCAPDDDSAAGFDDFEIDHDLWEQKAWPIIANRIPAFEAIKLTNTWVGHYAYNLLDQNAILGPHDEIKNFIFVNGFSGHGLQQSPAMGRGVAELICYGEFRTLDLSELGYSRLTDHQPLLERAVI